MTSPPHDDDLDLGTWLRAAGFAGGLAVVLGLAGIAAAVQLSASSLEARRAEVASAAQMGDPDREVAARQAWARAATGLAPQFALYLGWADPLEAPP